MGLDMYLFARKPARGLRGESLDGSASSVETREVDFPGMEGDEQIYYWRKHPNLHGWMEELYRKKGGESEFNCANVQLTEEDLDALEEDVRGGYLPHTEGFFFGESDGSEKSGDLEAIRRAREKIAAGYMVYYTSWW